MAKLIDMVKLARDLDLTQEALARDCDVSLKHMQNILHRKVDNPGARTAIQLALLLGKSVEQLWPVGSAKK